MATTSIWAIRKRLDHVLDYAMNPEKTSDHAYHDDMGNVLSYVTQEEKVEFVTGVNCLPEHARKQMMLTKETWNKTGGILAFHAYQSFKPGEATPEQAHAVGVEFARRMWGDRFQVVVATHIDKNHLHNHFVINSVSFVDGKKYYDNKETYYGGVRAISDQVCREFGLSVIENPKGKGKHYTEAMDEKDGKPTIRGLVKADVNEAIEKALSFQSFVEFLERKGYTVKYGPKVTHIAVRPHGAKDSFRLHKLLGEEYEESGIRAMIAGEKPVPPLAPAMQREKEQAAKSKRRRPRPYRQPREHKRLTGIAATYYKYLYMLGKAGKRKLPSRAAHTLRSDIAKFERYKRQFRFLYENRIGTDAQLGRHTDALKAEIDILVRQRKPLYRQRRDTFDFDRDELTAQIDEITQALRPLRRQLRLCEQIAADTPHIRAQAERAESEVDRTQREREQDKQQLRPKLGRS